MTKQAAGSGAGVPEDTDQETSDRRLLRGVRSRRAIARHAVDVASHDGLNGLTIGRLASDLGISKSGVQTLFGTKEALQLAAIEAAREAFFDAVVRPALAASGGAERLRTLIDRWIAYAEEPLFPGGCFWVATTAEFDSRPGQVRDALARQRQEWQDLIAGELRKAIDGGEIADADPALTAFQIDAVLCAANTALRLGDEGAMSKVHRVVAGLLSPT